MWPKTFAVIALLVSGGLVTACSGGASGAQGSPITIEAKQIKFSPGTLEVVAGQPVTLVLKNSDAIEHDFSVVEIEVEGEAEESGAEHDMAGMDEEPDLHVAAQGGQTGRLEFTPTQLGTYEFFCTVPGHKQAGMVGTLIVRER